MKLLVERVMPQMNYLIQVLEPAEIQKELYELDVKLLTILAKIAGISLPLAKYFATPKATETSILTSCLNLEPLSISSPMAFQAAATRWAEYAISHGRTVDRN